MHIENFTGAECLSLVGGGVSLCSPGWAGTHYIVRMTLSFWSSSCLILPNTRTICVSTYTQLCSEYLEHTPETHASKANREGKAQNRKARSRFPICPFMLLQSYQYTHIASPRVTLKEISFTSTHMAPSPRMVLK